MKLPDAPRLRQLLDPMSLAGLITWLAVMISVATSDTTNLLPLSAGVQYALVIASTLLFVVLMVGCTIYGEGASIRTRLSIATLQIVATLAICALSSNEVAQILMIIVMAWLASFLSWRALLLMFALSNTAMLLILGQRWGMGNAAIATLALAGFQLFAIMMTNYARRAETASAELQQVNAHLLATRTLLAESARDQERLRISRELHDVAGHKLTAIKLHLTALTRDPRMRDVAEVDTCAELADELLGDIRAVVRQMRVHDGMNLRAAIEQIAQAMPAPRAHVEVAADAAVGNALQAEALLRAVQEAITNAARHGSAENIWIVLRRADDRIELDVRDDGRGSPDVHFGSGLSGMRERLEALGGALVPVPARGRGFALHAWIPAR